MGSCRRNEKIEIIHINLAIANPHPLPQLRLASHIVRGFPCWRRAPAREEKYLFAIARCFFVRKMVLLLERKHNKKWLTEKK